MIEKVFKNTLNLSFLFCIRSIEYFSIYKVKINTSIILNYWFKVYTKGIFMMKCLRNGL